MILCKCSKRGTDIWISMEIGQTFSHRRQLQGGPQAKTFLNLAYRVYMLKSFRKIHTLLNVKIICIWPWNSYIYPYLMLLSSSHRKYQPYPLSYFQWLCAWDVCYIIFCRLLHIHSGKTGVLFSLLLCSLWWVQIVGYVLACRSCSFVFTLHHLIIIIVITYRKTLNL